jgi:tripartite-type tricarboxylate transporter receptor subunit TctC
MSLSRWRYAVVTVFALCFSAGAWGQTSSYPSRPIRLVVPVAPGGALDLIARALGQKLSEGLHQAVVVENKSGAATAIGTDYVAKSPPDGYTLLLAATTHGIISTVTPDLPYDPIKDFTPISLLATIPHVLVVNPSLPVTNLREFVQLAKSRSIAYGSVGNGTPHHLAAELFKQMAQIDMIHVPYKGTGPAMADLIAGQIQFMSVEMTAAAPHIRAGRLKALAVAAPQHLPGVDLPTVGEAGYPGFVVASWYGLMGPAGLPAPVVARLNAETIKGLADTALRERFKGLSATVVGSTPGEFDGFLRNEIARWTRVVSAAHIKAD